MNIYMHVFLRVYVCVCIEYLDAVLLDLMVWCGYKSQKQGCLLPTENALRTVCFCVYLVSPQGELK